MVVEVDRAAVAALEKPVQNLVGRAHQGKATVAVARAVIQTQVAVAVARVLLAGLEPLLLRAPVVTEQRPTFPAFPRLTLAVAVVVST
jgi:hypothetical protein